MRHGLMRPSPGADQGRQQVPVVFEGVLRDEAEERKDRRHVDGVGRNGGGILGDTCEEVRLREDASEGNARITADIGDPDILVDADNGGAFMVSAALSKSGFLEVERAELRTGGCAD